MTSRLDAVRPNGHSFTMNERTSSMTRIQVFDPAMCCPTGICGPSVDPQLVRFAADLDWLKTQGVSVERYNLSNRPLAFAEDEAVKAALDTQGEGALPLIKVDGTVQSHGTYPSRDQLATWAGVNVPAPSIYTEAVQELVSIGAAIASNCEPCFKFHYDKARRLGVSQEDMLLAVRTAQGVKDVPAASVLALADRYLSESAVNRPQSGAITLTPVAPSTGCCSGPIKTSGSCC
jgi:AhpD family alkylhydroperoxidase